MKTNSQKKRTRIFNKCKNAIKRRLKKKQYNDQADPIMTGRNIHYEMSDKTKAMSYGGIGAIHKMVTQIGLDKEIDDHLDLLKAHLPYHESDHVLNLAYNTLVGGVRLEDIELRRNDATFLDAIGAERIPDPTTAGDFTRRFDQQGIVVLMDSINRSREKVWSKTPPAILQEAIIDVDGTLAETLGECNPMAVDGLMCRDTISIDYTGTVYDCDFNQMLELDIRSEIGAALNNLSIESLSNRTIVTGQHCYGCTAGAGSSCQGATTS